VGPFCSGNSLYQHLSPCVDWLWCPRTPSGQRPGRQDATYPAWRASALGVYRFWRAAGYAIGALIGGVTAAVASLDTAIGVAAVLTATSGILAWALMREPTRGRWRTAGRRVPQLGEAARRVNGGMT
jgi:hypothetical protein